MFGWIRKRPLPPNSFRAAGRVWSLRLHAPNIKSVRQTLAVDLIAKDGSAFARLADDPALLVDCLWLLCGDQHPGVTDVRFGESLARDDAIEQATAALLAAVLEFLPTSRRAYMRHTVERVRKLDAAAYDTLQAAVDSWITPPASGVS